MESISLNDSSIPTINKEERKIKDENKINGVSEV